MTKMLWLRVAVASLGALALAALIWFAGPLIGIGESHPLDNVWIRVALVALVVLGIGGWNGWRIYSRIKAARALEASLGAVDDHAGDAAVLGETMKDALATLRKAKGGKGNYLYDLPWYLHDRSHRPPARPRRCMNSGLKFPLDATATTPETVARHRRHALLRLAGSPKKPC